MSRDPRDRGDLTPRDWKLLALLAAPVVLLWIIFLVCVCTGLVEPVQ